MKKITVLLSVLMGFSFALSPIETVSLKDKELQKVLKVHSSAPTDTTKEQITALINDVFDFKELSIQALGQENWDQNKETQERFVAAFRGMVQKSSLKKLEVYKSDSASYSIVENETKGTTTVAALVWNEGKKNELTYQMHKIEKEWKAWDLVIGGMSTLDNYKSLFKKLMKKKGYEGLLKKLEKKAGIKAPKKPETITQK
jgi:phospholipid transport system substrate-binding protein